MRLLVRIALLASALPLLAIGGAALAWAYAPGSPLASSVREAKKVAALRELEHGPGLQEADVVDALDRALCAEARKLSAVAVARRSLSLPRANEIVSVEVPAERRVGATAQLRAA